MRKFIYKLLRYLPIRNTILLESHSDMSDNTKALYDYLLRKGFDREFKFVWFVEHVDRYRDKGFPNTAFVPIVPSTRWGRLKNQYYLATSRFAFFSHRSFERHAVRKGTCFVNLWHGAGPKNPSYMDLGSDFDYVLYPSHYFKDAFVDNLSCRPEQMLPYGYSRNELLFNKTEHLEKFLVGKFGGRGEAADSSALPGGPRKVSDTFSGVIMWMPTFRKNSEGRQDFDNARPMTYGVPLIYEEEELMAVNKSLAENNLLLVVKLHPAQDMTNIHFLDMSNILFLTNDDLEEKEVVLYELLAEMDVLMTDYSSVYVDFLLIDRPLGFVLEDSASYKTGFFFENYLELMPGKMIHGFDELYQFFQDVAVGKDEFAEQRRHVNGLLNHYKDAHFSERIVQDFIVKGMYLQK